MGAELPQVEPTGQDDPQGGSPPPNPDTAGERAIKAHAVDVLAHYYREAWDLLHDDRPMASRAFQVETWARRMAADVLKVKRQILKAVR